jgi:hypothetical protein
VQADTTASFRLTRLYRKTSAKGATYFVGRLGGAKVALLRSRDTAEDGGEIWDLLVSEAPATRRAEPAPEIGDDAIPS